MRIEKQFKAGRLHVVSVHGAQESGLTIGQALEVCDGQWPRQGNSHQRRRARRVGLRFLFRQKLLPRIDWFQSRRLSDLAYSPEYLAALNKILKQ